MPLTLNKNPFFFGVVEDADLPTLPAGFSINKSPRSWVTATGPDGREWFVRFETLELRGVATEEDEIRTGGLLKVGTVFADDRTTIQLSK